ncbi:restriction endonuclease subunit S [Streptococcus mutans]|nr:restriction endonuclease subunit S [Streptococcus mutans]MCB5099170.1 restriction endonuclease subunit S [Streptococcus mutans]MDT9486631.1 restriction endonuclease subunit S [Streptococcus mutans]MDT9537643.1 restriction endonuclease subunit S [Streptococcus mutans]
MNNWKKVKLSDIINFNPREILPKGTIAKKIAMEKLEPFTRDIPEFEQLEFKGGTKFRNGDTLIARITPSLENGKTAKVSLLDKNEVGFGSTEFIVARAKESISDENFVYYLMLNPSIREVAIKSMVGTSGRQRVQLDVVKNHEILCPPLEEQIQIGKILSIIDDKIENNKKINHHLEQIAQVLFEQVYYDGSSAQLGDALSTLESGSRPKGGAELDGIPSIGAENIERFGQYDYTKEKFISHEYFKRLNRGVVHSGDVLLYKDGAYTGKVSMALDGFPHAQCAVNEHIFILRPNELAPSSFFLYFLLLNSENKQALFSRASSKAAQPGLNQTEVKTLPILLPKIEKIVEFDNTIAPFMHQITKNANENRKLSTLRDTLLPKLLSGEISVN